MNNILFCRPQLAQPAGSQESMAVQVFDEALSSCEAPRQQSVCRSQSLWRVACGVGPRLGQAAAVGSGALMPEASTPGSSTAMDNVASPVAHVHLDNSRVPKMPQPTPSPRHSHSIYRHARFNLAQLLELAKGLRNRPCVCDESQVPMFGAFSWAIILKFDDDVEWIFRSPRTDHVEISRDTSCRVLASEAATLRYLRQHTSIPVPDVHDFW